TTRWRRNRCRSRTCNAWANHPETNSPAPRQATWPAPMRRRCPTGSACFGVAWKDPCSTEDSRRARSGREPCCSRPTERRMFRLHASLRVFAIRSRGARTWCHSAAPGPCFPCSRSSRFILRARQPFDRSAGRSREPVKQFRLRLETLTIHEATDADAHEPIARARRKIDARTQCAGDFGERARRHRTFGGRDGSREDAEIGGLQLQHHAARDAAVRAFGLVLARGPGLAGEPFDMRREFVERQVVLEGVLG